MKMVTTLLSSDWFCSGLTLVSTLTLFVCAQRYLRIVLRQLLQCAFLSAQSIHSMAWNTPDLLSLFGVGCAIVRWNSPKAFSEETHMGFVTTMCTHVFPCKHRRLYTFGIILWIIIWNGGMGTCPQSKCNIKWFIAPFWMHFLGN